MDIPAGKTNGMDDLVRSIGYDQCGIIRDARKYHCYFIVFQKTNRRIGYV